MATTTLLAATPELYNLASADGGVGVAPVVGSSGLSFQVGLHDTLPKHGGVVGYPSVRYGLNPFCGAPGAKVCQTGSISSVALPAPVAELPTIWAGVGYRITPVSATSGMTDVAFDLWLTQAASSDGAGPGDAELMVWLDENTPAFLPPGHHAGEVVLPEVRGGAERLAPFEGTIGQAAGGWPIVYLIAAQPRDADRSAIDLSAALGAAEHLLAAAGASGPLATLYLEGIDFGTEFAVARPGESLSYDFTLDSFDLGVSAAPGVFSPPTSGVPHSTPVGTAASILPMLAGMGIRPTRRERASDRA